MNTLQIQITKADRELARTLGVQAGVVAQLRAEHGMENVREKLGFAPEKVENAEPAPVAEPAFVNLKVLRRCLNPTWVTCQADGKAVNVRVRRNNRLKPGMLLQCTGEGAEWKCVHAGFSPMI